METITIAEISAAPGWEVRGENHRIEKSDVGTYKFVAYPFTVKAVVCDGFKEDEFAAILAVVDFSDLESTIAVFRTAFETKQAAAAAQKVAHEAYVADKWTSALESNARAGERKEDDLLSLLLH